ncbi:hypothetical protein [Shewanella litoralis]|uniref:DUF1266 domain-containing protein n=1 Tax=Shewanella litoralis TaxID=2282700 RepID=A0ABQ2RB05_9GAMM|nr:hypothetical protein [Shewanella litoralis]GGQ22792.1 hypothetical protein GCM10009411_23540 [Shewanella litoralis]
MKLAKKIRILSQTDHFSLSNVECSVDNAVEELELSSLFTISDDFSFVVDQGDDLYIENDEELLSFGYFETFESESEIELSYFETSGDSQWEYIVLEDKFFDVEDNIDYDELKYHERLLPQERARQLTSELALEYFVDDLLFVQLENVLIFHKCHGQTKKAMRELLKENIQANELALILELREYWVGRECFARTYYNSCPDIKFNNLSWILGLAMIRLHNFDDIEEAIQYLEDCFDDWSQSLRLLDGFRSFRSYILHIVDHTLKDLPPYLDYQNFVDDNLLAYDFSGGEVYKWLQENNLLH